MSDTAGAGAGDGSADPAPYRAVADHLNDATLAIEHIDYNHLTHKELARLLAAHETLSTICLCYRRRQHTLERDR